MIWIYRVLLALSLSATCCAQGFTYLRIHRPLIEEKLKLGSDKQGERLHSLRTLFEKAGCPHITEQAVPGQESPNLICTLPGSEAGTIVVGASAGYKDRGERGDVQWSGLAMLPLLAESLNAVVHRHTLVFIAFTGRLQDGSSWYTNQLSEAQRKGTVAMVDLNEIGRTPPICVPSQNDETLAKWLATAARSLNLRYNPYDISPRAMAIRAGLRNVPQAVAEADAKSFSHFNIPAITLRSLTEMPVGDLVLPGGNPVTKRTTAVDLDAYEDTYRLLCIYVLVLDRQVGKKLAPAPEVVISGSPAIETAPALGSSIPASQEVAAGTPDKALNPVVPAPNETPVFHAQGQLVQVDVSVTDKQGRPVQGLTQADFTVMEDGKPQEMRAFEAHVAPTATSAPPKVPLPPNTYTNQTDTPVDDTVSLVFFDTVNTPPTDQIYARKQLIEFLHQLPRGRRVALFILGTRLQMVQGFTDDPDVLVKATEKILTDRSLFLTTDRESQQTRGEIEGIAKVSAPGGAPAGGTSIAGNAANKREQSIANMEAYRLDQRINVTLAALEGIARLSSGYPGRKNLVWLSGSFPIQLRPDLSFFDMNASTAADTGSVTLTAKREAQERIRATTKLLAAARIAVYPVDVRGLQTTGVDMSLGALESGTYSSSDSPQAYSSVINGQSDTRFEERRSMVSIADQTGGEAFTGTNDLRRAMERSMNDGSNYYTLAYTPPNSASANPAFRRIEVKLAREGMKLAYRPGYYPTSEEVPSQQSSFHALAVAMQRENPPSTMLTLKAQVLPPDETHSMVRIDYVVDAAAVTFAEAANKNRRALVDFMVVAFDKDGRDAGHSAQTMDATLPLADYEKIMKDGLPMHQELSLPPGTYTLRLGVMDRPSQKVGTVDVPLTAGRDIAKRTQAASP